MAVYKPSNLSPSLAEIDFTENNTFSCQVNTSGESIRAYKYEILRNNTDETIYESQGINLSSPIRNKGTLNIENISNALNSNLTNGRDYLWGVRVYDTQIGSTEQPTTKVCTGYLVGSTQYVIWTTNNEKLEYDRYIEFETNGNANIMPILEPNEDNLTLPGDGVTFRERIQIDWVEKELGFNKNITKIECVDNFTYNYINGTPFKLFLCGDEHTYTSVYADPNDAIDNSYYITIYENESDATNAHNAGDTPASVTITPRETGRRIIGYSSTTGEIRVQEPFNQIPVNGNAYLLYEYDRVEDTYTEIEFEASNIVGGKAIEDDSFVIMTNYWDTSVHQLFIQPNINIKPDATNPNEIVFDDNMQRVDIIETTSTTVVEGKTTDITIEKLDNTQWLLRYMSAVDGVTPPVIPGSTYTVYTDFMDSSPYSLIYARKTPVLTMQYKNLNSGNDFININSETPQPWRDIQFYTNWQSENRTQVKYYQYILYDVNGEEIARSEEIYDSELTWYFRGFQTSDNEVNPVRYTIEVNIVDEYDARFTTSALFTIFYTTEQGIIPLNVTLDCEEQAMKVEVTAPVYVESTDRDNIPTIGMEDLDPDYDFLRIPEGEVLNYTRVINETQDPIIISPTFSFLTQFQITDVFIDNIPLGGDLDVIEVAHKINDTTFDYFTLKLSSFKKYYMDTSSGNAIIQVNTNQFRLKWYKNGSNTPLTCWNDNTADYFDLSTEIPELMSPGAFSFALRLESEFNIVDTFPLRPVVNQKYVLTQDIVYNGKTYYQGVYTWSDRVWSANTEDEFVFVENLSQIPGFSYDDLSVPENVRSITGDNGILWAEEGNVWVDTGNYVDRYNKNVLNTKWILLRLLVDNTNSTADTSDAEIVTSQIEVNDERL